MRVGCRQQFLVCNVRRSCLAGGGVMSNEIDEVVLRVGEECLMR